jgi:hypothetical protein
MCNLLPRLGKGHVRRRRMIEGLAIGGWRAVVQRHETA